MALRTRDSLALAVVLLLMAASCSRTPQDNCSGKVVQLRTNDVLTVGADFAYPPFAFDHPDTGAPTGFEVDLVERVAEKLRLKLLLVNRSSGSLIPGALAHRHDLAASGLRDKPNLRREACLSSPYLDADLGILVRAEDPRRMGKAGDLVGRTVAVQQGSPGDVWARAHLGRGSLLRRLPTSEDLLTALRSGVADAVIDDLPVQRYAEVRLKELKVAGVIGTGEHYVFAANPSNGALMKLVNDALEQLREDGTIDQLQGRWFGS